MQIGRNYPLHHSLIWTRREIFLFIVFATIPTTLYYYGYTWVVLPWLPIAAVATAVAFITGFKNNASYDRLWEARKIWGAIVNSSRTWATLLATFMDGTDESKNRNLYQKMIFRHIAWLTSLRYQLRTPRQWETIKDADNAEYSKYFDTPEADGNLKENLAKWLSSEDLSKISNKANSSTQILALQGADLREMHRSGTIDSFKLTRLSEVLQDFFDHQGKCERIKNFPYPRQFATLNYFFIWLFVFLVPFGLLGEFAKLGEGYIWLTIPFSTIVCWVFHTMEKIGSASENPFEGGANDVPITSLSRTIEIDLLDLLDADNVPKPTLPQNNILM